MNPSQHQDQDPVSRAVQDNGNAKLVGAKEVLKEKLMKAVLQQAINELGEPATLARAIMNNRGAELGSVTASSMILRELILADIEKKARDSFSDVRGVASELFPKVTEDGEATKRIADELRTRLLDAAVNEAHQSVSDVNATAGEVYASDAVDKTIVDRVRASLRTKMLAEAAKRSMQSLDDFEAAASEVLLGMGENPEVIVGITGTLRETMLQEIERRANESIEDRNAAAANVWQRIGSDSESIKAVVDKVHDQLLGDIASRSRQSLADVDSTASSARELLGAEANVVVEASKQLEEMLVREIVSNGERSLSNTDEAVRKALTEMAPSPDDLAKIQESLKAKILNDVLNRAIGEINDEVGSVASDLWMSDDASTPASPAAPVEEVAETPVAFQPPPTPTPEPPPQQEPAASTEDQPSQPNTLDVAQDREAVKPMGELTPVTTTQSTVAPAKSDTSNSYTAEPVAEDSNDSSDLDIPEEPAASAVETIVEQEAEWQPLDSMAVDTEPVSQESAPMAPEAIADESEQHGSDDTDIAEEWVLESTEPADVEMNDAGWDQPMSDIIDSTTDLTVESSSEAGDEVNSEVDSEVADEPAADHTEFEPPTPEKSLYDHFSAEEESSSVSSTELLDSSEDIAAAADEADNALQSNIAEEIGYEELAKNVVDEVGNGIEVMPVAANLDPMYSPTEEPIQPSIPAEKPIAEAQVSAEAETQEYRQQTGTADEQRIRSNGRRRRRSWTVNEVDFGAKKTPVVDPPMANVEPVAEAADLPEAEVSDTMVYLYGIVAGSGEAVDLPSGGVDPGYPVRTIDYRDLSAIVSSVPREEFHQDVPTRMPEASILKDRASKHAGILEHVKTDRALIPMRFGTVYDTDEAVLALLASDYSSYENTLTRVDGKQAWYLRVYRDSAKLAVKVNQSNRIVEDSLGAISKGVVHFVKEEMHRLDDIAGDEASALMTDNCVQRTHTAMSDRASENVVKPNMTEDDAADMIFCAAYLVDEGKEQPLKDEVARLSAEFEELGFNYSLKGPLPPFDFVADASSD